MLHKNVCKLSQNNYAPPKPLEDSEFHHELLLNAVTAQNFQLVLLLTNPKVSSPCSHRFRAKNYKSFYVAVNVSKVYGKI